MARNKRSPAGRGRSDPADQEPLFDILGGAEIEFEQGVEAPRDAGGSNRLILSIAGLGAAALVASLLLLPADTGPNVAAPPIPSGPSAAQTTTIPVPRAGQPPTTLPGPLAAGARIELLTTTDQVGSAFSLVELSEQGDGEQAIRLHGLEGESLAIENPLYFRATNLPSWPGERTRPFVTAGGSLVFLSRGEVVVTDLDGTNRMSVGTGVSLVDGLGPDEFWAVGPGSRWVARYQLDRLDIVPEQISMVGVGRPVAAVSGGLVVVPPLALGLDGLAVWRPEAPLLSVPVPDDLDLFGAAGDLVVLGNGERLNIFNIATGEATDVQLDSPLDVRGPRSLRMASDLHSPRIIGLTPSAD